MKLKKSVFPLSEDVSDKNANVNTLIEDLFSELENY